MQAYAICHGVTAKSSVTTDELSLGVLDGRARLASYQFHPVSDKSGKVNRYSFVKVSTKAAGL